LSIDTAKYVKRVVLVKRFLKTILAIAQNNTNARLVNKILFNFSKLQLKGYEVVRL